MTLLHKHTDIIFKLCKNYKVKELYAFGSVLSDSFTAESDVDFMVSFLPLDLLDYADNYFDFKFSLEKALNRPIDLLEENAIKNPYFKDSIDKNKQLIYES